MGTAGKYLRRAAAVAVALVAAVYLAVAIAGYRLSRPAPAAVGPAPAGAEEVVFASASGSNLHGWWRPGCPGCGAVVLLHPLGGNRRSVADRFALLSDAGFTLLAIDLQAHGESGGAHMTFGYLEARDVGAALDLVGVLAPDERVGILGVSLGGAAALLADGVPPPQAIVLEAVPTDFTTALGNRLELALGPPGRLLTPLFEQIMPWVIGVRSRQLRPIDAIDRIGAPLLMIVGSADRHARPEESRAMFEKARPPKLLWEIPGAAHENLYARSPDEYRARVVTFFTERLRR